MSTEFPFRMRIAALLGSARRWEGTTARLAVVLGCSERHLRRLVRDAGPSAPFRVTFSPGRGGGVVVERSEPLRGAKPFPGGAEPSSAAADAALSRVGAESTGDANADIWPQVSGFAGRIPAAVLRFARRENGAFRGRRVRVCGNPDINPDISGGSRVARQNSSLSRNLTKSLYSSSSFRFQSGAGFGEARPGAPSATARVLVRSAANAAPTDRDSRIERPSGRVYVGCAGVDGAGLRSDRPSKMHAPQGRAESESGQKWGGGSEERARAASPPAGDSRSLSSPQSAGGGTPAQNETEDAAALEVLAAWSRRLWAGKQPVNRGRCGEIRERLAEGFSVRDLLAAVEGAARSPHNHAPGRRTLSAVFGTGGRVSALACLGVAYLPPVPGAAPPAPPASERRRREIEAVDGPICPPAEVAAHLANLLAAAQRGGGKR